MNLMEATATLLSACETADIGLILEYETGRYIPGEFIDPKNPLDHTHVEQGPAGWRVEIGGFVRRDEDGNETLYPKLMDAIGYGLAMLAEVLKERKAARGGKAQS